MGIINLPGSGGVGEGSGSPLLTYSLECREGIWYMIVTGVGFNVYAVEVVNSDGITIGKTWQGIDLEFELGSSRSFSVYVVMRDGRRQQVAVSLGDQECSCLRDYHIKFQCRNGDLWMDFSSSSRCGNNYEIALEIVSGSKLGYTQIVGKGILCNPTSTSFKLPNTYQGQSSVRVFINIYEESRDKAGNVIRTQVCDGFLGGIWETGLCGSEPDTTRGL